MAKDLALNRHLSVHLDDRNDLATVEGIDAFEQSVAIMLTDLGTEILSGLTERSTVKEKIKLAVTRVARDHDRIDEIAYLDISKKPAEPDSYEVTISYIDDEIDDFSDDLVIG